MPGDERLRGRRRSAAELARRAGLPANELDALVRDGECRDRRRHEEGVAGRRLALSPANNPADIVMPGARRPGTARAPARRRCRSRPGTTARRRPGPRAPPVGEPEDPRAHDEHHGDEPGLPEHVCRTRRSGGARRSGRDRDDGDQPREPPVGIALERAVADRREAGREQPPPVVTEIDQQRQQRPEVEHTENASDVRNGSSQPNRAGTRIRCPERRSAGTP